MLSLVGGFISMPSFIIPANENHTYVILQEELSFSPISLNDIPSIVKSSALDTNSAMVITGAKVAITSEGEKIYKITMSDIEGNEETALYNEDGSIYKE